MKNFNVQDISDHFILFFMFHSHLSFAHALWRSFIKPGDTLIDATLGNGHDALILAEALQGKGTFIGYDIQQKAIEESKKRLAHVQGPALFFHQRCHSLLTEDRPKLVVYNLGYLPGSDKSITTLLSTTLASIKKAQDLLIEEGIISITLYPGHEQGLEEYNALLDYAASLDKKKWLVNWTSWPNRKTAPSLLNFQKK